MYDLDFGLIFLNGKIVCLRGGKDELYRKKPPRGEPVCMDIKRWSASNSAISSKPRTR